MLSYVSCALASLMLIISVIVGTNNQQISHKVLHISIASIFLAITPVMLYIQYRRFFVKGPFDWVAWTHFFIFSLILFLVVKMLKRWAINKRHSHVHIDEAEEVSEKVSEEEVPEDDEKKKKTEKFIVNYKGEEYDISDFVKRHPGGSIIQNARNRNLEEVWDEFGVSWHKNNSNVMSVLEKYKS